MGTVVLEKEVTRSAQRVQISPATSYTKEVCGSVQGTEVVWRQDDDGEYFLTTETVFTTECRTVEVTEGPEFRYEWSTDLNKGWNAGARSIDRVDGDFYFSFGVNPANRTAVGVGRELVGHHYRDIPYAFYFIGDQFYITEWGRQRYAPVSYVRADSFSIVRVDGSVIYKHNDQLVYASQVPSAGSMIALAAMYMGGDRVT